jgi:hypothetical protein
MRLLVLIALLFLAVPAGAQLINPGGGGSTTVPWTSATTPSVSAGGTITLPTFTSLVAGLTITGGWNNAGNFPGLLTVNANPNTSSGAQSLLFDLQLAGTSKFNVNEDAAVQLKTSVNGVPSGAGIASLSTGDLSFYVGGGRNWNMGGVALTGLGAGAFIQLCATSGCGLYFNGGNVAMQFGLSGVIDIADGSGNNCGTSAAACRDIEVRGLLGSGSQVTIAAAGGTCAAAGAQQGGTTVGTIALSGTCASTNTITLGASGTTLPTARTGWNCRFNDRTTAADANNLHETSTTTTAVTATWTGAGASGDVIDFTCIGY